MRISDWSSDVCSSDLVAPSADLLARARSVEKPAITEVLDRESGEFLDVSAWIASHLCQALIEERIRIIERMNERQRAAALPLATLRKHRRATAALSALVAVSITRHGHRPGEAVDERAHVAHAIATEALEDVLRPATRLHQRRDRNSTRLNSRH